MLGWLLAVLIGLVLIFWRLGGGDADLQTADDAGRYLYAAAAGAIVLLYAVSIAGDYRGRWGKALRRRRLRRGSARHHPPFADQRRRRPTAKR